MITVKTRNIIEMAYAFSAMGRVFKRGAQKQILQKFEALVGEINADNVLSLHEEFISWFQDTIKTARGKRSSYGQAAKVVDIMLKVCVSYCRLPTPEEAEKIVPKLHGAVDNLVLDHYMRRNGLGDLTRELYQEIQSQLKAESAGMPLCEYDDILWRKLVEKTRQSRNL